MVAVKQLETMLTRYQTTVAQHYKMMGPTYESPELSKVNPAIDAAMLHLKRGDMVSAMHLVGFVQGILFCTGLHTWEYLVSDDRRG